MKNVLLATLLLLAAPVPAQEPYRERLSGELLDVMPPSARVSGEPGEMHFVEISCRNLPLSEVRRRIVDVAVQEWAFFGFSVDDQTQEEDLPPRPRGWWRFTRVDPEEAARVAPSIGGYWTAAPYSEWILARQNEIWKAQGVATRWRDPWSAAFISWVMCESGLGESARFQRAIAHHSYIDQAILARDEGKLDAAFLAYDPGEAAINPGDLLCRGSRPNYRSIAERRAQLGVGARTHCDIVVKVDEAAERIMTIGGNVRGSVRMKILPAGRRDDGHLRPTMLDRRAIFAHLKLQAEPIAADALIESPTIAALGCGGFQTPAELAKVNVAFDSATCGP